jgi:hypothetical protein
MKWGVKPPKRLNLIIIDTRRLKAKDYTHLWLASCESPYRENLCLRLARYLFVLGTVPKRWDERLRRQDGVGGSAEAPGVKLGLLSHFCRPLIPLQCKGGP